MWGWGELRSITVAVYVPASCDSLRCSPLPEVSVLLSATSFTSVWLLLGASSSAAARRGADKMVSSKNTTPNSEEANKIYNDPNIMECIDELNEVDQIIYEAVKKW